MSGYQDDLDPDDSLHSIPNLPVFQDSTPSQVSVLLIHSSIIRFILMVLFWTTRAIYKLTR